MASHPLGPRYGPLRRFVLLLVVCLVPLAAAYSWLFRTVHDVGPDGVALEFVYAWGKPRELLADRNGDGRVDFKANYRGAEFETHRQVEYWEDLDYDGVFDLHATPISENLWLFELDREGDGSYDARARGRHQEEFLREVGWASSF